MTEGEVLDNNIVQFPPFTTTTTAIMRQLKHHEKKLLKKVDFLNVSMSRRARSARGPHSRPDLALGRILLPLQCELDPEEKEGK